MTRLGLTFALLATATLAACGSVPGTTLPETRAPQVLRAIPVPSATPDGSATPVPTPEPTATPAPKHTHVLRAIPVPSATPTPGPHH